MISLLGSEIGRGHPFYLDGLRAALGRHGARVVRDENVFTVSRGASRAAWKSVRAAYHMAGRGGVVADLYHRLRAGQRLDEPSLLQRALGRDLRTWAGSAGTLVVDHPLLVAVLRGRDDTWYMHGEMVAPQEAMVRGMRGVFVPTAEVAQEFQRAGIAEETIYTTGLCVEDGVRRGGEEAARERCRRLQKTGVRHVGFFSSGAEPAAHVATLVAAAVSCRDSGRTATLVAQRNGRFARSARSKGLVPREMGSRPELDALSAEILPQLDAMVSPPHERSNWAVGLGIPFFLVGPDIGPFAPANRALLLSRGVAHALDGVTGAAAFSQLLDELQREQRLVAMARNGMGAPLDGFDRAADILIELSHG